MESGRPNVPVGHQCRDERAGEREIERVEKLKERWEEEDIEKEREREVDERRGAWKWEMNNPGDFSGI